MRFGDLPDVVRQLSALIAAAVDGSGAAAGSSGAAQEAVSSGPAASASTQPALTQTDGQTGTQTDAEADTRADTKADAPADTETDTKANTPPHTHTGMQPAAVAAAAAVAGVASECRGFEVVAQGRSRGGCPAGQGGEGQGLRCSCVREGQCWSDHPVLDASGAGWREAKVGANGGGEGGGRGRERGSERGCDLEHSSAAGGGSWRPLPAGIARREPLFDCMIANYYGPDEVRGEEGRGGEWCRQ